MEQLPDYESRLMAQEPFKYFEESYPKFYFRFFRYLLAGQDYDDQPLKTHC